ncbi:hypothetical protein MPSEU_000993800 [Mayamaea pseudoterrestris]|nr:hypothetical protein MPSEU_000993800 [Mayamaea pseudoterrestris]
MRRNDILVSFQSRTLVFSSSECPTTESVLDRVCRETHWPRQFLTLSISKSQSLALSPCSFYSVNIVSCIRGGKGGFGTLLKGAAKQAGAKATTDFGACRDLQGRRLKHVNDQVAYQEWKDWNDKIQAGVATKEDMAKALMKSSVGAPGWYLQLPSWAEVSQKKQQSQMHKQFHAWKRELDAEKSAKEQAKEAIDRQVHEYVDRADQLSVKASQNTLSALQEGLRASKRQKTQDIAPPEALITLSGDVVLALEDGCWCMQSPSNFCTVGILLEQNTDASSKFILYYEARLLTGGICQIGWATAGFSPDSSTGDGVGDDLYSWAYDPSRRIKLFGERNTPYGSEDFKAGDVVGCLYDGDTGEVSFSLNGKDLGVAYQIKANRGAFHIYPAISCNPGEITELRFLSDQTQYRHDDAVIVGTLLAKETYDNPDKDSNLSFGTIDPDASSLEILKAEANVNELSRAPGSIAGADFAIEPLKLDEYESAEQLETLGLEKLKGALTAMGVKCGGSLKERAARLYSLKGLDKADYPKKLLAK